jgi:hypothetical protein
MLSFHPSGLHGWTGFIVFCFKPFSFQAQTTKCLLDYQMAYFFWFPPQPSFVYRVPGGSVFFLISLLAYHNRQMMEPGGKVKKRWKIYGTLTGSLGLQEYCI